MFVERRSTKYLSLHGEALDACRRSESAENT